MLDKKSFIMCLELTCAIVVTASDVKHACLLHPVGNHAPNSGVQVEDIPAWGKWQLGNVADQLSLRRQNIEPMPAGLARAIKHEMANSRVKRDMHVES